MAPQKARRPATCSVSEPSGIDLAWRQIGPVATAKIATPQAVFKLRCEARALLWRMAAIGLQDAVDILQAGAVRDRLVAELGQDAVQEIMANAFGGRNA